MCCKLWIAAPTQVSDVDLVLQSQVISTNSVERSQLSAANSG